MAFKVVHKGDFRNLEKFLKTYDRQKLINVMKLCGAKGVAALSANTPERYGTTAASWDYIVDISGRGITLSWTNSHINQNIKIAILIQYGHATGTGGYVQGRDYINPAIQPIFDDIANALWEEVQRL